MHNKLIQGAQAGNLLKPVKLNLEGLYFQNASETIEKWNGEGMSGRGLFLQNILSVVMYNLDWKSCCRKGVTDKSPGYFNRYLSWFRRNDYLYLDANDRLPHPGASNRWIYVAYASRMESLDINTPQDLAFAETLFRRNEKNRTPNLDLLSATGI